MFESPYPGLFVVRYRVPTDLDPLRQPALIEAIRAASLHQAIAIVFVIGDAVRSVDFAVPMFWLKILADPAVRIGAMAMVTESKAVEIAAKGFAAANRLRSHALEVKTFDDEANAVAWARGMVAYQPFLAR
jgi:hypothetical protein